MDKLIWKSICNSILNELKQQNPYLIHSDNFRNTFGLEPDFYNELKQLIKEQKPGFTVTKQNYSPESDTMFFDLLFSLIKR